MLSEFSYPIICSEKFAETVAFYEDHFGYMPAFEIEGFVILKRQGKSDMFLAVMDAQNPEIPEGYRSSASGLILNFPVDDVNEAFQKLYWDGLAAVSDPKTALCGRKHFFVRDPNGILIDVAENIDLESLVGSSDEAKDMYVVA